MKSNPLRKFLLITSLLTISLVATWAFDVVPYLGTITKFDARGYFGALKNNALTIRSRSTSVNSAVTAPLFAPCGSITTASSPILYRDMGVSNVTDEYVAYKITNTTGSLITDLWVRLTPCVACNVTLSTNEDGLYHVGPLAAGAMTTVYFYVHTTASTNTAQSLTLDLFEGNPTMGGTTCTYVAACAGTGCPGADCLLWDVARLLCQSG